MNEQMANSTIKKYLLLNIVDVIWNAPALSICVYLLVIYPIMSWCGIAIFGDATTPNVSYIGYLIGNSMLYNWWFFLFVIILSFIRLGFSNLVHICLQELNELKNLANRRS